MGRSIGLKNAERPWAIALDDDCLELVVEGLVPAAALAELEGGVGSPGSQEPELQRTVSRVSGRWNTFPRCRARRLGSESDLGI